jgi:hypothetical protein
MNSSWMDAMRKFVSTSVGLPSVLQGKHMVEAI